MRPVSDLGKLHKSLADRLLRLRRLYGAAIAAGEPRRSQLLAVSIIELDNAMLSSLRAFTISTFRGARTASGTKITVAKKLNHQEEVGAFLLSVLSTPTYKKLEFPQRVNRRVEPTVRDPRDTEKVFIAGGASNIDSLRNALALNTSLFNDSGTIRNFYAHKNEDTWRKARAKGQSLGILNPSRADEILTFLVPGRPVSIFEDWLDDAFLFFEEATR